MGILYYRKDYWIDYFVKAKCKREFSNIDVNTNVNSHDEKCTDIDDNANNEQCHYINNNNTDKECKSLFNVLNSNQDKIHIGSNENVLDRDHHLHLYKK